MPSYDLRFPSYHHVLSSCLIDNMLNIPTIRPLPCMSPFDGHRFPKAHPLQPQPLSPSGTQHLSRLIDRHGSVPARRWTHFRPSPQSKLAARPRLCRTRSPCPVVENRKVTRSPQLNLRHCWTFCKLGKTWLISRQRDHLDGTDHCSKRQVSAGMINSKLNIVAP